MNRLGSVPQVSDPHIQHTLDILWRGNPHPAFLAGVLATYAHREPVLLPLVHELAQDLNDHDRAAVLARLEAPPKPPTTYTPQPVKPPAPPVRPLPPPAEPEPLIVRADPELGRLAVGLGKAAEFRVWVMARHHFGAPGWAMKDDLFAQLQADDVIRTRRHFNRLLKAGADLFWGLGDDGRVWLRGVVKVAARLARIAWRTRPQLVITNLPGAKDVYVRGGGELGDFKAQVYAAWLTHREDPTIARETLCTLFHVTADTLRNWEARLGGHITIIPNYAQTALHPKADNEIYDYLPSHSTEYVTRRGEIRLRWRMSNTYRTVSMRQHPRKGQSRKVRVAAAVAILETQPVESGAPPPDERDLAFDRAYRVPRRYFASEKALQSLIKRMARRGQVAVTPGTPRFVFRGMDRNEHGIWELSLDGEVQTSAHERMPIKQECRWFAGFEVMNRQKRAQVS